METKNEKERKQKKKQIKWLVIIAALSFSLSLTFGTLSEIVLSNTGIALSVVIILVFVSLSMISDMVGVAVTAADVEPFRAMASKKVKGGKEALFIIKHADKMATICCDVIGDVCGILSGAAGATIIVKIAMEGNSFLSVVIASLVSAVIATMTIFGKAVMKKFAINHSTQILSKVGKLLALFHIGGGNKNSVKVEGKKKSKVSSKQDNETAKSKQKNKTKSSKVALKNRTEDSGSGEQKQEASDIKKLKTNKTAGESITHKDTINKENVSDIQGKEDTLKQASNNTENKENEQN